MTSSSRPPQTLTPLKLDLLARTPLAISRQGSFFVGGRNVLSNNLSISPLFAATGTITVDQIYVRYQEPVDSGERFPLVFIHGAGLTGKSWETTPDGRMGWDEYFVRSHFPVYVIDQSWRGRSGGDLSPINAVKANAAPISQLPELLSYSQESAWVNFRFGPDYPKVFTGQQFPVEAIDAFWKEMTPDWFFALPTPNPTIPALSELAQKLEGCVLISHSQSGLYPFQAIAMERRGIAGIVAIEPAFCPLASDDLTPYKDAPILILFGDRIEASQRWLPRLQSCREFVAALNAIGGKAELVSLPEIGVLGNSHMLMQDKNSLEVAAWLVNWIETHICAARQDRA